MFGLKNIIIIYPYKAHKIQVPYSFGKTLKLIFINSDLLNLIPCELDIKSTPFSDTTIITYKIELPPSGKEFGFNLLGDEDFTIP